MWLSVGDICDQEDIHDTGLFHPLLLKIDSTILPSWLLPWPRPLLSPPWRSVLSLQISQNLTLLPTFVTASHLGTSS